MAKKGKKGHKSSRQSKRKRTAPKNQPKHGADSKNKKPWNWKPASALTAAISLAIGLGGLVALRPRIEMSLLDNLDHSQPFSRPLRIHNIGYLPVNNINIAQYTVRLHDVGSVNLRMNEGLHISLAWGVTRLSMDESKTILWNPNDEPSRSSEADIAFIAKLSPYGLPFIRETFISRFIGQLDSKGQLHFLPQPIDEPLRAKILEKTKDMDSSISSLRKEWRRPAP